MSWQYFQDSSSYSNILSVSGRQHYEIMVLNKVLDVNSIKPEQNNPVKMK